MDTEREDAYYELLEEMIDSMTQIGGYDRDWIVDIVKRICELFRLTKAETRFYRSEELERLGDGEVISDYDNGKSDHIAMQKKAVSKTDGSLTCLVYMAKGDELNDDEKVKVDLMLRIMINFIGRNRLHNAVELLVEEDEQNEIRERELHIREIFPGKVHTHSDNLFSAVDPSPQIHTNHLEHFVVKLAYVSGHLEHRNKIKRRNDLAVMEPSAKRLRTDKLSPGYIYLGLIENVELAVEICRDHLNSREVLADVGLSERAKQRF